MTSRRAQKNRRQPLQDGAFLRGRDLPVLLVLAAVALLAYGNSLHVPFQYDDFPTIVGNSCVRLQRSLRDVFILNPFRPLLVISFMLNYRLSGLDFFSYHVTNLIMHLLNGVLLYLLLRRLHPVAELRLPAALASSLALAHPLFTEGVTFISSRSTLQATMFLLASVHLYYNYCASGRIIGWLGSLVTFILAAGTKEIGAIAPILWSALVILYFRRSRRCWLGVVPGLLLFVAGAAYRLHVFFNVEYQSLPRGIWNNVITQFSALTAYMRLFVFPRGLTIAHDLPVETSLLAPTAFIGGLLFLSITGATLLSLRRLPHVAFLLILFLVSNLPTFGLFPLVETMAEHRFYLPGFALCGMTAFVFPLAGPIPRKASYLAAAVLVMIATVATHMRNRVWQSEESLWADAVAKQPHSARALSNYADVMRGMAEYQLASQYYLKALQSAPNNFDYTMNLGICLRHTGNLQEAEAVIGNAQRINPRSPKPLVNLGNICQLRGDYACARSRYEEALELDPKSYEALMNLGYLCLNVLGDKERASQLFDEARRMDPVRALSAEPARR